MRVGQTEKIEFKVAHVRFWLYHIVNRLILILTFKSNYQGSQLSCGPVLFDGPLKLHV